MMVTIKIVVIIIIIIIAILIMMFAMVNNMLYHQPDVKTSLV